MGLENFLSKSSNRKIPKNPPVLELIENWDTLEQPK